MGRWSAPSTQRRPISAVARWVPERAATALIERRRPATKPGEPGWSALPGGARSTFVLSGTHRRQVVPAQMWTRHPDGGRSLACPGAGSESGAVSVTAADAASAAATDTAAVSAAVSGFCGRRPSGSMGRWSAPSIQRRPISAVARWVPERAATTLIGRRRPVSKLRHETSWRSPWSARSPFVRNVLRCREALHAQIRTRHIPKERDLLRVMVRLRCRLRFRFIGHGHGCWVLSGRPARETRAPQYARVLW